MQNKTHCIQYSEYPTGLDLNSEQLDLLETALAAAKNAYAPYSKFSVGVAILLANGIVVTGCNQENASFPCGICAERAALFTTGSLYPHEKILRMAISVQGQIKNGLIPVAPCGLCRQVMAEFEENNLNEIELILGHPNSISHVFPSFRSLLPFSFNASFLQNT